MSDPAKCARCGEPTDELHYSLELDARVCWECYQRESWPLRAAEIADEFHRRESNGAARNGDRQDVQVNGHDPAGRQLVLTTIASVQPESVRWAWRDRIVLGMLNVIVGEPGLGKSTLAYDLAAKMSRGELDGDLYGHAADVLVVTYEDHIASVVRPRLEAASADLGRIHDLGIAEDGTEELLTLPRDIELIQEAIERTHARLLLVDPIVASLGGEVNSHRDQDIRRVLAPLAQLAEQHDVAVVVVMHVNKSTATQFFMRVGASIGFTGAARSMLLVARDPDDPDGERGSRRIVAHGKCNVGAFAPSLLFEIESVTLTGSGVGTSRLQYLGECETSTADLLGVEGDDERTDTDLAGDWLADELADRQWHESRDVKERAELAGIKVRTLQRAKTRLKIEDRREGFPAISEWRLPVAPTVAPTGSADNGGATGKPPVVIGDQLGLGVQSRHIFEVGATGDEDELIALFKEQFDAEELSGREWAEFERSHPAPACCRRGPKHRRRPASQDADRTRS